MPIRKNGSLTIDLESGPCRRAGLPAFAFDHFRRRRCLANPGSPYEHHPRGVGLMDFARGQFHRGTGLGFDYYRGLPDGDSRWRSSTAPALSTARCKYRSRR
jgi:hypothetical protein